MSASNGNGHPVIAQPAPPGGLNVLYVMSGVVLSVLIAAETATYILGAGHPDPIIGKIIQALIGLTIGSGVLMRVITQRRADGSGRSLEDLTAEVRHLEGLLSIALRRQAAIAEKVGVELPTEPQSTDLP